MTSRVPTRASQATSSNHAPFSHDPSTRGLLPFSEHIPESERLVARSGNNHRAVGAHAQVQHTICVTRETDDLVHGGVLPDVDRMLRVPVSRDEFGSELGEEKITDLAACVV